MLTNREKYELKLPTATSHAHAATAMYCKTPQLAREERMEFEIPISSQRSDRLPSSDHLSTIPVRDYLHVVKQLVTHK
jgi:hypothetical protein